MKSVFNKILIALLLLVTLLGVGCSCSKDEYAEYPTATSFTNYILLNNEKYYSIYYNNNLWRVNHYTAYRTHIVAKENPKNIFASSTITGSKFLGEDFIYKARENIEDKIDWFVKEGYIFPSEKDLEVKRIMSSIIFDNEKNDYISYSSKSLSKIVFTNVNKTEDLVDKSTKITLEEFNSSREKYQFLLTAKTLFTEYKYFYLETNFYIYSNKIMVVLSDGVYNLKQEYLAGLNKFIQEEL